MVGKIKGTNGVTYDITLNEEPPIPPAQEIKVAKHTITAEEEAAADPITITVENDASSIVLLSCYVISLSGQYNLPTGLGVEVDLSENTVIIVDAGENLDEGNVIAATYIVEEE